MKFALLAWAVAAITGSALAQPLSTTEPVEGYEDDFDFGGGGTFRPFQFDPSYGSGGVDAATGLAGGAATLITIGNPASGGLSYSRDFSNPGGHSDNFLSGVDELDDGTVIVTALGQAYQFESVSAGYSPLYGHGATLEETGSEWIMTGRHGTVYRFAKSLAGDIPVYAPDGRMTKATFPDGSQLDFSYDTRTLCALSSGQSSPSCSPQLKAIRLLSVTSSLGHQIKYEYQTTYANYTLDYGLHTRIKKVTALNNTIDACSPTTNGCTGLTQSWPSISFTHGTSGSNVTVTVENALSQETRYTYDSQKRLKGIRFPSSGSGSDDVAYGYDGNGRVSSVSRAGINRTYAYADSGGVRTTTITAPYSHTTTIRTEIATQLTLSHKTPLNQTTSYSYNADDLLQRIDYPDGRYVTFAYDGRGNVTSQSAYPNGSGGASVMTTSSTYPGSCTPSNRKICNKPTSITDWRGTTNFTYSTTHGGLTQKKDPAGTSGRLTTDISYTGHRAKYKNTGGTIIQSPNVIYLPVSSSTDGISTTIAYDGGTTTNLTVDSLTLAGGGDSGSTQIAHDIFGNVTSVDGPLAGSVDKQTFAYDALRRPTVTIGADPDGGSALLNIATKTVYDTDGRVQYQHSGTATSFSSFGSFSALETLENTYDSNGFLTRQRLMAGIVPMAATHFTYDAKGRLLCTIRMMHALGSSPSGCSASTGTYGYHRITRRTYDAGNRIISSTSAYDTPDAITESMGYTTGGQVAWVTDGEGNRTTFEYDGHGRRKKTRYPNPSNGSSSSTSDYDLYTYVSNKPLIQSHRRRDGQTISYGHDALGNVTSINAPGTANDLSISYNIRGLVTQLTGSGQTLSYGYDTLGRQTSATSPLGTVTYDHNIAGQRTRIDYPGPNNFYVTYSYGSAGQLTHIREKGATSGAGVLARYEYDQLGNRTKLVRGNGVVTDYGYDAMSRLAELDFTLPSDTAKNQQVDYAFNPAGQIVSKTATNALYEPTIPTDMVASQYNDLNQLTSHGGQTVTHDARGNLTNDGTTSYGYDVLNRLVSVGSSVSLSYDPAGRLYQETASGSTTRMLYDGQALIAEYNTSGTVQKRYVHGAGVDEPLVWYEGSGTSDRRFLVADERGSIVLVTRSNGTTLAVNKYDEYGVSSGTHTGRFGYTGQTSITGTDLWHYKARAYAPSLGRFLQTDPIGYGDGLNMYAYVGGDPINSVDPSGLCDPSDTNCDGTVVAKGTYKKCMASLCVDGDALTFYRQNPIPVHLFEPRRQNFGGGSGGANRDVSCNRNVMVKADGNNVTIRATISIGNGERYLRNGEAKPYVDRIQSLWSGNIGRYRVSTTLTYIRSDSTAMAFRTVPKHKVDKSSTKGSMELGGRRGDIPSMAGWDDDPFPFIVASHEFGHGLGLPHGGDGVMSDYDTAIESGGKPSEADIGDLVEACAK